jgi:hypothetical protein
MELASNQRFHLLGRRRGDVREAVDHRVYGAGGRLLSLSRAGDSWSRLPDNECEVEYELVVVAEFEYEVGRGSAGRRFRVLSAFRSGSTLALGFGGAFSVPGHIRSSPHLPCRE